jgi:hypothetical protein
MKLRLTLTLELTRMLTYERESRQKIWLIQILTDVTYRIQEPGKRKNKIAMARSQHKLD